MLGTCLDNVRRTRPLVHCITNYVTANDAANILLACGASPVMSDDPEDAESIAAGCGGLCLNLGTLSRRTAEGMRRAGRQAAERGRPILLDPVGIGASALRTDTALELLDTLPITVIRGNISEIRALALGGCTRGVDAAVSDAVTEENLENAVVFVRHFAQQIGAIVAVTGAIDLVSNETDCWIIRGGRPEMRCVTGTGCQLSAMMTAFLAANLNNRTEAAAAAVCAMNLAGEIGWRRMKPGEGNATYRNRMIDAVYNMDGVLLKGGARFAVR